MGLLVWLAAGICVGFAAQFALRDKWSGGMTGNLIVGALGAVIAGWILSMFGLAAAPPLSIWGLLVSVVGAAGLLWAGRAFTSSPTLH